MSIPSNNLFFLATQAKKKGIKRQHTGNKAVNNEKT